MSQMPRCQGVLQALMMLHASRGLSQAAAPPAAQTKPQPRMVTCGPAGHCALLQERDFSPREQGGYGPSTESRDKLLLDLCKHCGGRAWPIQTKAWRLHRPGVRLAIITCLSTAMQTNPIRHQLRLHHWPSLPLILKEYQKGEK